MNCLMHAVKIILAAMTFAIAPAQAAEPGQRPLKNIGILADNLGCGDCNFYNGWGKTPQIDRMAKEGITFTDFDAALARAFQKHPQSVSSVKSVVKNHRHALPRCLAAAPSVNSNKR